MRPILAVALALTLCATMLGCGADTPTLPSHAKVYGVTIDRTGQPATHYRIHTKGERDAEAIELSAPGIYCPTCKHHIPVLQDDPTRAPWLEQPPANPPEPPAGFRLVPSHEGDCPKSDPREPLVPNPLHRVPCPSCQKRPC